MESGKSLDCKIACPLVAMCDAEEADIVMGACRRGFPIGFGNDEAWCGIPYEPASADSSSDGRLVINLSEAQQSAQATINTALDAPQL